MRTFSRRNRTVLGKGPQKVLIGQNLTRFLTLKRQLCKNDSFSFGIMWIKESVVVDYDKIWSFTLSWLGTFVPVKENVTDFCCVLNFLGMKVPNSVFEILSGHWYSSLQTQKCCKFYDERVEENDKTVRQKDGWIFMVFRANVWCRSLG